MGPGVYRVLLYSVSLFTSHLGYGKNDVQTNHMCDRPNCLHIDVVGTVGSTEGVELRLGEIEEGSPDDVHVELDLPTNSNHPKEGPLHIVHFLINQLSFYHWI